MGREENVIIFNDTEKACKTNERLKQAVKKSRENQYFLAEDAKFEVPEKSVYEMEGWVRVTKKRTLEAASE